jgi:signal transduction histidine kinase
METVATRILLVEDEVHDALIVDRSLRLEANGERFELRHASTLAQGLERLARDPVDVLLLDLGLPDSDGPDTVARLRDCDPRVPLVVFTGADDPELMARSFAAGADEYLVKDGLHAELLRRTIHHAVARRQLRLRADPAARPPSPRRERALLHELKNLQTCILGNAELLQREVGESEWVGRRAEALVGAARLAADLTKRLSAGAEGIEASSQLVELSEFVRGAEPLLRAALPERVELRLEPARDLPPVPACVERLRSALLELVVNAVEAIGDADGRIEVSTGAARIRERPRPGLVAPGGIRPGPHVWVEVADTGGGFAPSSLASLFERGFTTKGRGRGRGLSDVKEVLVEHRAALAVRSRPGRGSAFRILLPAPTRGVGAGSRHEGA